MKIKSIVSALLAVALTAALAIPAFAASDINEEEQRILDTAAATTVDGVKVVDTYMGAQAYNQLKNFLMWDDVDLDSVDANNVITKMWAGADLITEAGYTTYDEIYADKDLVASLTALGNETFKLLGLDVTFTWGPGGIDYTIYDYEGRPVSSGSSSSSSAVKQTGIDFVATWAVLALVVAAVAGCAVFVKKSRVEI